MTSVSIHLDGDGCWPDLDRNDNERIDWSAELQAVALIPDGQVVTPEGTPKRVPIVTLRVQLSDGRTAIAQIKLEMLELVFRALQGRMGYLAELASRGGTPS